MYHHRTSVLTKNINIYDRDINKVVSEFTRCILQEAKEAIPKGARKEYKPYWNNDLDKLHNELNTARDVAESEPTSENNTTLKQVNAKFIRARNDARRKSWISKTADLNMEKDGNKLWRLTKQLNDEIFQDHTNTRRHFNTWENSSQPIC